MPSSHEGLEPAWLPMFLAVAEELNYTRAAERLFLTQSAVSRQMQALRRAAGAPLVEQLGKRLALTDAGRALLGEARRLRGDLRRTHELLDDLAAGNAGTLRIGASSTPGLYVLPPILARFARRRPRVAWSLVVASTLAIEEGLLRNELDLGFVGGRLARAELAREPFAGDQVAIFAARTHPLARRRTVRPEELGEHTCILPAEGSATRSAFDDWLARAGVRIERRIEVRSPESVKPLVASGLGLGVASRHALVRAPFATLPVAGLDIRRELLIAQHRDKRLSPPARELREAVLRESSRGVGAR